MNHYNPVSKQFSIKDIKITNAFISIHSLTEKIRFDEINVNHRIDYFWGEEKMSRLIESILLKIPLPVFYFDVSDPSKWISIDGFQQLNTINRFILQNNFKLNNMEVLTHLNGFSYSDLDNYYKRVINDTQIITYQIEAQTPLHLREIIFRKIRDMNEN